MSDRYTIGRWIRDRGRNTPGRVAIDYLGREVTYVELDERSERLAAWFLASGLKRGDHGHFGLHLHRQHKELKGGRRDWHVIRQLKLLIAHITQCT